MVKVRDRFSARWQARQDRKLMREAAPPKERIRTKLAKWLKPKDEPAPQIFTRDDRRRAMRAAGQVARRYRLQTPMRRPLVAVNCRVRKHPGVYRSHKPDRRVINALARRKFRELELEEAS